MRALRSLVVAHEEVSTGQLRRHGREPLVRFALDEHGVGALEPLERGLGLVQLPLGVPEHGLDERGFPRRARSRVQLLGALELTSRRLHVPSAVGGSSGPVAKPRLFERIVREFRGLCEDAGGLDRRGQRRRALSGPGERVPRLLLELRGILGFGHQPVGLEVVGGDHLDDLLLVCPGRCEVPGSRQVTCLAVGLRERLVCDPLQQVLEEPELAALRRARVRLEGEYLLADEAEEERLDLGLVLPRECGDAVLREGLAEHRCVVNEGALLGGQPVEACREQRVQRLGNRELLDRPRRAVRVAAALEQPAVEQHPHRLDRVERNALGAAEDLRMEL